MPPPEAPQPTPDPIVGAWRLNIEKSANPTVESELITITQHGDQFQIVFQAMQSNGYNPHYQVTTRMKGETSELTQWDGKPMNDSWRVTRSQPNVFVVESMGQFAGVKEEYAVSADDATLTVQELPGTHIIIGGKMDSNGVIHPFRQVFVFERISEPEGRVLSEKMAEKDAAQRARASERAAAMAASDASGCHLASVQSGSPEAVAKPQGWNEYVCPEDGFAIIAPNAPVKHSRQRADFYKLFMTEDESIVAQLWVSVEPVDCAMWLRQMREVVNRPRIPGSIPGTTATTIQGSPAFESVDRHTNGPMYLLYDLNRCSANRVFRFHARWLTDQPKPEEVTRIFDSFRLLTEKETQ